MRWPRRSASPARSFTPTRLVTQSRVGATTAADAMVVPLITAFAARLIYGHRRITVLLNR